MRLFWLGNISFYIAGVVGCGRARSLILFLVNKRFYSLRAARLRSLRDLLFLFSVAALLLLSFSSSSSPLPLSVDVAATIVTRVRIDEH